MATEHQRPGRPEDLPPTGWMQGPEFFGTTFRKHPPGPSSQIHEPVLPYHYDVLASARSFLAADKYDVAVIMAQTACEIATDDVITVLLRRQNLSDGILAWINKQIESRTTLKDDRLYGLDRALSCDELRKDQKALWEAYVRRADLRNDIVHAGAHAVKGQAVEACDTALDLFHHFEAMHACVVMKPCGNPVMTHSREGLSE